MPQSNLTLIYGDYAAYGTLVGGSWQSGSLGLANLLTPYFAEAARSTSTQPSDTQFKIVFDRPRIIGGVALGPCNVRPDALCRYRAYDFNESIVYDSGLRQFPGSTVDAAYLEWEEDGFWEGRSAEFDDLTKGAIFIDVIGFPLACSRIDFEIFDDGNPAGYIEIGRLICGRSWTPQFNYTYDGNSLDFEALTDVEESRSGVRFFNPRPSKRSFSFSLPYLDDAETFDSVYRIVARSGRHRQVVVIPNPADPATYTREAFIGTLGVLPSLRRVAPGLAGTNFKIEETL